MVHDKGGVEVELRSSFDGVGIFTKRNQCTVSQHPGKEKAGNLSQDFLPDGAADRRLLFSFESSGQVGPKMDRTINRIFPFKAYTFLFAISLDDYFFHNQSMYL